MYTIAEKSKGRERHMLQNLHTHTHFCDGKDSADEKASTALDMGFNSIGFSSHAPTVHKNDWEMKDVAGYIAEVKSAKENFKGRLSVLLGIELDYYSASVMDYSVFDYRIGSVHMAFKSGVQIDFDHSATGTERYIKELFSGDSIAYAKSYYDMVATMPNVIEYDIVGHFDVLTKFSETYPSLIDIESKAYKNLALEALHAVREKQDVFEVNTGAISRGHRTTPYPAPFILDEMKKLDCKLVLTSDCHDKKYLTCNFDEAKEYIKAHGFSELYYLEEGGFAGKKI